MNKSPKKLTLKFLADQLTTPRRQINNFPEQHHSHPEREHGR
jgi:hypothetical protein